MLDRVADHRMTVAERTLLARDGFVLRQGVFDAAECAAIAADCEALVSELAALSRGKKHALGSYMFEVEREAGHHHQVGAGRAGGDPGRRAVRPHLGEPLNDWGLDRRFIDPAKAIVGEDELVLFTEKLNVKRARDGGHIILHQDFPYWEPTTPVAHASPPPCSSSTTRPSRTAAWR